MNHTHIPAPGPLFHMALTRAVEQGGKDYIDNITIHTVDTYNESDCYLVFDGLNIVGGFAVLPGNELVSVFSLQRGVGHYMRQLWREWWRNGPALHLDCFEHLVDFYRKADFTVDRYEDNWTPGGERVAYMSQ